MNLFNTLSGKVDPFVPQSDQVTIYVCGITPYDTTHLGHAFTYTAADILIRYLERKGYSIRYVQNVTDIDDDILKRAEEVNEDWRALGNRWTRHYIQDMQNLNVRPPDFFPRATDAIQEIIEWVQGLLDSGVAYESGESVYYDVNAWANFGELSHIPRTEMLAIANERGNHPDDPNKRDPLDFVLWQAWAAGEPSWESPWGAGRPGWHIECSTLSTQYLGENIDIHGGGADLSFPHHECEIAQVEPITGKKPFVRNWMHTAMVFYNGDKMSKSLGNLVWVRDLLKKYSPDALRLYLGKHHYREEWNFNELELEKAGQDAELILKAVSRNGGQGMQMDVNWALERFEHAMENDLDTPDASETMIELAQEINTTDEVKHDIRAAQEILRDLSRVFGLQQGEGPEARVVEGWGRHRGRFQ